MCALNISCLIRRAALEAGCSACQASEAQEGRRRGAVTPSAARPPGKRETKGRGGGGKLQRGEEAGSRVLQQREGRRAWATGWACASLWAAEGSKAPRADGPASDR